MENPWKTRFFVLLTMNLLVLLGVVAIVKAESDRSVLYAHIYKGVRDYEQGFSSAIDFSSLPLFKWERMFIFRPSTPCGYMNGMVRSPLFLAECEFRNLGHYENGAILVFKLAPLHVRFVQYDGIVPTAVESEGYAFGNARFMLDRDGYLVWLGTESPAAGE